MPKACKISENEGEKHGFAIGESVEHITSEQSVWLVAPKMTQIS